MNEERIPCPLVFVSYSREDEEWRRKFVDMLRPLVREQRLDVWSDDRMLVAEQWRPQISEAISRSRAALLLVSSAFLASDFIMEQELPELLDRGVPLVCVLVGACLWDKVPVLKRVEWAHNPREGPLESSSDPAGRVMRVCYRLLELLPETPGSPATQESRPTIRRPASQIAPRSDLGALHGVPQLPEDFVARDELAAVREAVLRTGDVGITGMSLGLYGQGGIGKTVLASALARNDEVRRYFPDGIHWVTVGERGDVVAAQIALLASFGLTHDELRSARKGLRLLRKALAEKQCLLVVDDVWSRDAAQAFSATGPRGRVVYTSRDPVVLRAVGAHVQRVDVLPEPAARELLAGLTGSTSGELPVEAAFVLEATQRVALALALVGAAVGGGGRRWRDVADQLSHGSKTFLDHPYANLFKAMQVATSSLDPDLADAYRTLAVFPEDTRVPVDTVERYWWWLYDATPEQTRRWLRALATRELLSLDDDAFSFQDLQRDFLLLHASDLAVLHADLLAAHHALLDSRDAARSELPGDQRYIHDHLVYHLQCAGKATALRATAGDLAFLATRAFRAGPHAAESDLRRAAEALRGEPVIDWLLRLLEQWGHLLGGHRTVGDLAMTLRSRIRNAPPTLDVDALRVLLPEPFMVVRWGLSGVPAALDRAPDSHAGLVNGVAIAGQLLASASDDGTVRLWDAAAGTPRRTLHGHAGRIFAVAMAHDGRLLASVGDDRTVRLWDTAAGTPVKALRGHTDWVGAVAISRDGRLLASAGNDRAVRLWDVAAGTLGQVFRGHADRVDAVAISRDSRLLASAGLDGTLRLWDIAAGTSDRTLEGHAGGINAVAFSPDGGRVASAGDDGIVRLWDTACGAPAGTLEDHTDWANGVAFSPDGRYLASAGEDRTVRLWDAATASHICALRLADEVQAVAWSTWGIAVASHTSVMLLDLARPWSPEAGR